jgi:lipopolysaccharide/colanic/teichoic acid biosynthesis glycosyltransferase
MPVRTPEETNEETLRRGGDRREQLRLTVSDGDPAGAASPASKRRAMGLSAERTPVSIARVATVRHARVLLPALAAFVACALTAGVGQALLIAAAIGLVSAPLHSFPMPLHLMPTTRILLALAPPAFVCGAFAIADAIGPASFAIDSSAALVTALIAAEAAMIVEILGPMWLAARPIRIATLGAPDFALALDRELAETGIEQTEMVGWIDQTAQDSLSEVVLANRIDLVVRVSGPRGLRSGRLGEGDGFEDLLELPVRTIGADQLYENLFGHVPMGTIDTRWYLYMLHPEFSSTRPFVDRLFEMAVAVPVMLVASPFLALAAIAIKLGDGGPIFYRQTRIGAGGRPFEILKLRTMSATAEQDGARWSSAADARVTPAGRVLRRLHLDELPQLLNVLRGEMTLVGPRPEQPQMVTELERIFPHYSRRHLVKPGVTGWAQVRCGYAGSTLGTAWKLCHDLYYLKRRSRLVDLMMMIETLMIAGLDAHRPLRVPASQFLFGQDLGLDLSDDARGPLPPEVRERSLAGAAAG